MKVSKSGQGNPVDLDQLSTEELEGLLRNDFIASRGQSDPEFVTAAMEVIARRKDKAAPEVDVDAAWETFRTRMKTERSQEEEDSLELSAPTTQSLEPRKKRRWLRRTVAVAAVVAVLTCLSLVPVQGTSLAQTLVSWTGDTFSFSKKDNSSEEQKLFSDLVYQQVEERLSTLVDQPVLPTWYPEGSSVIRVEENQMDNGSSLVIVFALEDEEFFLSIGIYNNTADLPTYEYEKNKGSVEEYYANGIPHYIMSNLEQNTVTWRTGNAECSIHTFLPVDTLKEMIDSIYAS